jgi:hypothetical protein
MKRILITYLSLIFCILVNGQEFLAKVKRDCKSLECSSGLIFKKDELIVVFRPYISSENWHVWTSYGPDGCLDTTMFQIIPDKPIFKLKFNPEVLRHNACSQGIKEEFDLINVDYCEIINRIISKDLKALTYFFDLIPKVDAALAETHAEDTWPIISLFSDKELRTWIETLDNNRLTQFFNYLSNEFVAYPIFKYSEYLDLYYPTSWEILRKCK